MVVRESLCQEWTSKAIHERSDENEPALWNVEGRELQEKENKTVLRRKLSLKREQGRTWESKGEVIRLGLVGGTQKEIWVLWKQWESNGCFWARECHDLIYIYKVTLAALWGMGCWGGDLESYFTFRYGSLEILNNILTLLTFKHNKRIWFYVSQNWI